MNLDNIASPIRILIAGSAQSGNTWLLYLLAEAYRIEIINIPLDFDFNSGEAVPGSWVAQEHFHCKRSLIKWAKENSVHVVTPIRHPGDTLISTQKHIKSIVGLGKASKPDENLLANDLPWDSPERLEYVRNHFYHSLACSMSWIDSGQSCIIRYENLWRNAPLALKELCNQITPLSEERIHKAVRASTKEVLSSWADTHNTRFRTGSVGHWNSILPSKVLEIFAKIQPYPLFFSRMGYTLDPQDPLTREPQIYQEASSPLVGVAHFNNGALVARVMLRIYAHTCYDTSFENIEAFYTWLNSPADDDPTPNDLPLVSNLAAQLYQLQPYLSKEYPDLFEKDRARYIYLWYLQHAASEFSLSDHFIEPVRDSFIKWASQGYHEEPDNSDIKRMPMLTNIAMLVHDNSQELLQSFPDLLDEHRTMFAAWCLDSLTEVTGLPSCISDPIFESWQNLPSKVLR